MYEKVLKHHEPTRKYKSKPGATISHLSEWLLSKREEITSVGEGVEKKEPFCALLVRMQMGAATMEHRMEFPQKFKNGATI